MPFTRRPNLETTERFVLSYDHAQVSGGFTVTLVTKANFADSDYMTIDDGVHPAVLYEFDTAGNGATAGRVAVNIFGATTAADCAAILAALIPSYQPELTVTDNLDGTLTVTKPSAGCSATENVANAGFTIAATAADSTFKFFKASAKARIDSVRYINPTGLSNHAANYFTLAVKNGSTVVADWSTETGQEGAIAADTFVTFTNGSSNNRVLAAGDVLSFSADETGTQTLPPGRVVVEGRYL